MRHKGMRRVVAVVLLVAAAAVSGCGYRVAPRAASFPVAVETIAVPTFENHTTSYRMEQRVTEAVVRELLTRTRYHVVSAPESGEAVLRGAVNSLTGNPVIFDTATGRATAVLVTASFSVVLEERAGGVLYRNDNLVFRETYEISTDIGSFFQEEGPALDRMARDVASAVVSAILESF